MFEKLKHLWNKITGQYRLTTFELECSDGSIVMFALKNGKFYLTPKELYTLKTNSSTEHFYRWLVDEKARIKFV